MKPLTLLITALSIALLASPSWAQHPSVRVQVIDRGQADGILIRTPNEKWVIIDAGQDEALGAENVHCTSRHGTVRGYGRPDGSHRIFRQFQDGGSCCFSRE